MPHCRGDAAGVARAAAWRESAEGVDTGRTYRCNLPSGKSIDLFFDDGPVSREIAFDGLLRDGGALCDRLVGGGRVGGGTEAWLGHVATDGETYGHHHRYGDMALAYALSMIDRGEPRAKGARLTNYGEFRALAPATWEVEIAEDTSWSCAHGVERWRSDCGCHVGGGPGWNQSWRAPLRRALDGLAARAAEAVDEGARTLVPDVSAARDAYIDVVLERGDASIDAFVARHAPAATGDAQVARVLELMELARNAMLMFTSCGWFFDDLAGLEPVQILQYAARACELAERIVGPGVEAQFVDALARARSNDDAHGDGRRIWARRVLPAKIDLAHVAAHHAVAALVADAPDVPAGASGSHVVCYEVETRDRALRRAGKVRLLAGMVRVVSRVTRERAELGTAVLHLGEHHLSGGVRPFGSDGAWAATERELATAFGGGDLFAVERTIGAAFAGHTFTLGTLFPGERRAALARLLAEPIATASARLAAIYDEHAPLVRYLVAHELPVPDALRAAGEVTLRRRLLDALAADAPDPAVVRACIAEAAEVEVDLDTPEIAYAAGLALAGAMDTLVAAPGALTPEMISSVGKLATIAARMKSEVDLWHAQNAPFRLVAQNLAAWRAAGDTRRADELARLAAAVRIATPSA